MGIHTLPHLPQATTTARIKRNVTRMGFSYRLQYILEPVFFLKIELND